MDWLELVKAIGAVPVFAFIAFLILARPLIAVLQRVGKVKVKDLEIELVASSKRDLSMNSDVSIRSLDYLDGWYKKFQKDEPIETDSLLQQLHSLPPELQTVALSEWEEMNVHWIIGESGLPRQKVQTNVSVYSQALESELVDGKAWFPGLPPKE